MKTRTRVLVFVQAPAEERATIEGAYRDISAVLEGTPGLLRNELLHSCTQPNSFVVMSEWEDMEAFRVFEKGPVHCGGTMATLRQYTTGAAFYEVLAAYQEPDTHPPGVHLHPPSTP